MAKASTDEGYQLPTPKKSDSPESKDEAHWNVVFMQNRGPADFASPKVPNRRRKHPKRRSPAATLQNDEQKHLSMTKSIPNSTLLEHIATSRFFHHYVSPTRTFFRLDLDFTHAVIEQASNRPILAEAIIAMGILTLPNKSREVYTAARIRHSRALRLTNQALLKSEYARSDEMLMAVILLGFYETTPDTTHSITSWTSHLDGARHLLHLRGLTLLDTDIAYRMFNVLRLQIVSVAAEFHTRFSIADRQQLLNCFMTLQKVPDDLIRLSDSIRDRQTGEERAASDLMSLYARMCNLVAFARQSAGEDPTEVVAEARSLDEELVEWGLNAPSAFNIEVKEAAPGNGAFSDTYETYLSIFSAEIWIIYRSARLGVNGLLASLFSDIAGHQPTLDEQQPATESPQHKDILWCLQERLEVMEILRNGMCSAIPFLMQRDRDLGKPVSELPLYSRTLPTNILILLTRMEGTSIKMCSWAESLLVELQTGGDVDDGAIWMNKPVAVNDREVRESSL